MTTLIPHLFPPNVTGVWHIDLHNEAASERIQVRFTQTGSTLTGAYVGPYQISRIKGTLDGQDISFQYSIDGMRIFHLGRLGANTITGTYHAGEFDQGEFRGWRVEQEQLAL